MNSVERVKAICAERKIPIYKHENENRPSSRKGGLFISPHGRSAWHRLAPARPSYNPIFARKNAITAARTAQITLSTMASHRFPGFRLHAF